MSLSSKELEKIAKLKWGGIGCVGLFLAPFFIVGVWMLIEGLGQLADSGSDDPFVLLFVGAMFTGVSVAILASIFVAGNSLVTQYPLRKKYPDQPWMWREDWARGVVHDKALSSMAGRWLAAILTAGGLLFVASRIRDLIEYHLAVNLAITGAILAVVAALVIYLLYRAIYTTLQYRRFGRSTLLLAKNPCAVGASLSGRVETSLGEIPQDGATLRLECVKATRSSSGKNSSTTYKTVWSADQTLESYRLGQGPTGVYVPVEIPIPPNANPTGKVSRSTRYLWKLKISASLPGVDYHCEFEPPVFRVDRGGGGSGDTVPRT